MTLDKTVFGNRIKNKQIEAAQTVNAENASDIMDKTSGAFGAAIVEGLGDVFVGLDVPNFDGSPKIIDWTKVNIIGGIIYCEDIVFITLTPPSSQGSGEGGTGGTGGGSGGGDPGPGGNGGGNGNDNGTGNRGANELSIATLDVGNVSLNPAGAGEESGRFGNLTLETRPGIDKNIEGGITVDQKERTAVSLRQQLSQGTTATSTTVTESTSSSSVDLDDIFDDRYIRKHVPDTYDGGLLSIEGSDFNGNATSELNWVGPANFQDNTVSFINSFISGNSSSFLGWEGYAEFSGDLHVLGPQGIFADAIFTALVDNVNLNDAVKVYNQSGVPFFNILQVTSHGDVPTPPSGEASVYLLSSDKHVYEKDSDGITYDLTEVSGTVIPLGTLDERYLRKDVSDTYSGTVLTIGRNSGSSTFTSDVNAQLKWSGTASFNESVRINDDGSFARGLYSNFIYPAQGNTSVVNDFQFITTGGVGTFASPANGEDFAQITDNFKNYLWPGDGSSPIISWKATGPSGQTLNFGINGDGVIDQPLTVYGQTTPEEIGIFTDTEDSVAVRSNEIAKKSASSPLSTSGDLYISSSGIGTLFLRNNSFGLVQINNSGLEVKTSGFITLQELNSQAITPSVQKQFLYPKTDNRIYSKNSLGQEFDLTVFGSGVVALSGTNYFDARFLRKDVSDTYSGTVLTIGTGGSTTLTSNAASSLSWNGSAIFNNSLTVNDDGSFAKGIFSNFVNPVVGTALVLNTIIVSDNGSTTDIFSESLESVIAEDFKQFEFSSSSDAGAHFKHSSKNLNFGINGNFDTNYALRVHLQSLNSIAAFTKNDNKYIEILGNANTIQHVDIDNDNEGFYIKGDGGESVYLQNSSAGSIFVNDAGLTVQNSGILTLPHVPSHAFVSTPSAGNAAVYILNSDKHIYEKDSAGTTYDLTITTQGDQNYDYDYQYLGNMLCNWPVITGQSGTQEWWDVEAGITSTQSTCQTESIIQGRSREIVKLVASGTAGKRYFQSLNYVEHKTLASGILSSLGVGVYQSGIADTINLILYQSGTNSIIASGTTNTTNSWSTIKLENAVIPSGTAVLYSVSNKQNTSGTFYITDMMMNRGPKLLPFCANRLIRRLNQVASVVSIDPAGTGFATSTFRPNVTPLTAILGVIIESQGTAAGQTTHLRPTYSSEAQGIVNRYQNVQGAAVMTGGVIPINCDDQQKIDYSVNNAAISTLRLSLLYYDEWEF